MKIAVTYENGMVFQHFGHSEQFKIYTVENNMVISEQIVSTNGSGHSALSGFLNTLGADTLICGGIGGGAKITLAQAGIKVFGGVTGSADLAVQSFLAGTLDFNPDVVCAHHENHSGDCSSHDHNCGHNCGK